MTEESNLIPSDKKNAKWITFLRIVIIALPIYLIIKCGLYSFFKLKNIKDFVPGDFWKLAVSDFEEHIDLIGITIGVFIAFLIDINTKDQFGELKAIESKMHDSLLQLENTNAKIKRSTKNLEDATRKIIETLPGILDESINIVQKVKKPQDKLFIMNYTSKFGVIHSFNKRFVDQIKISMNGVTADTGEYYKECLAKKLNVFKAKFEKLNRKICKASRKIDTFRLITYDDVLAFDSCFLQKYFQSESVQNLFYYPYQQNKAVQSSEISITNSIDTTTISKIVKDEHIDAINELNKLKQDCVTKKKEIPYQMILVEYQDAKNNTCNESLIIYAVDEKDNANKFIKRNFIGISSKNKQMFKAFETMFNE